MKIAYKNIEKYYDSIKLVSDLKLPRKLTVALVRNTTMLEPIVQEIIQQRTEIAQKYCVVSEDGNIEMQDNKLQFANMENAQKFVEEVNEMLSIEEDINLIVVNADVLETGNADDGYDILTANQELGLNFMLDYEEA